MFDIETNNIKCLMVGGKGVGKTTFLQKFPNSKLSSTNNAETYNINCLNEAKIKKSKQFDYLDIQIENYDITTDTLFVVNQNDLLHSNNKIINTTNFKVIILCFAMDDPSSFELIKSKWKLYLKKNNAHHFILLGLKSDTINTETKVKKIYKERSSSVSSNSSTSKLHLKKMRNRTLSENDSNYQQLFNHECKRFAKKISSFKLIQSTSLEHSSDLFKSTRSSIESYVNLSKSICKCYMKKPLNVNKTTDSKIPKSLTAPINFLVSHAHRSRKPIDDKKELTILSDQTVAYEKQDDKLHLNTNLKMSESLSIRKKFSQLFIGLGTYLVTCGTGKSRQLRLNNNNTNNTNGKTFSAIKSRSNLVKKDKSWLLLSSEVSLNNLENDDVFLN